MMASSSIKKFILFFFLPVVYAQANTLCEKNINLFSDELQQTMNANRTVKGWGPVPRTMTLSTELQDCFSDNEWKTRRLLAAADYWIKQKLNYCHHYLPVYPTPLNLRNAPSNKGGYCSHAKNIMPGSPFYGQQIRWNYSGTGDETLYQWVNHSMWYGFDCSNYTAFLYNFALGLRFSSNTLYQAGQRADHTQDNLSPNQQSGTNILNKPKAAGKLVCKDNSLEINHSCINHGGYLSVIDSSGNKHSGSIRMSDLASLHPGDLLFIASPKKSAINPSAVVHVVMWTGKQVSSSDIRPEQIAPNGLCSQKDWLAQRNDWVITDSHYQGPDYRVITPCYYLNNLWGVRRVIY